MAFNVRVNLMAFDVRVNLMAFNLRVNVRVNLMAGKRTCGCSPRLSALIEMVTVGPDGGGSFPSGWKSTPPTTRSSA